MAERIKTAAAPARRSRCKALLTIARANLESWFYSPRTIVALVFIVLICYMEVAALNRRLQAGNYAFHYPEMMFYVFYHGVNARMISTMLLIAICEMPRRMLFQNYALIRSSRKEFLGAQILYCLVIVLVTMLVIVLCASLFTVGHLTPGDGWSDDARIATEIMREDEAFVPEFFRMNMTPGVAIVYAMLPMFFYWFTMLLVVLLFSIFGKPLVGVVIYAFILWSATVLMIEAIPWIILPTQFAPLRNISLTVRENALIYYWQVIAGYVIVDLTVVTVMYIRIKRCDLVFNTLMRY